MLINVWPKLMAFLLERTGKSVEQFADDADIAAKTVRRLQQGKSRHPGQTFDGLAKAADMTPEQLSYLYTQFMMKECKPFGFEVDLGGQSEVREPAATYDPPTARERAETLVRFDMRQISPHLSPPLKLILDEIREILDESQRAEQARERRLLRLVELFERVCKGAIDLSRELESLRDK